MSIERIIKYDTGYTQVLNLVLYDASLSLKAKGLYAYLFSKPDNWQFHVSTMTKDLKESKNTIYSIVNELIEKGYIQREQINQKGVFGEVVYTFKTPENIDVPPCPKKPYTVKPDTENWEHNNTNISNTYESIFDQWWKSYPRKVSKREAFKKYKVILAKKEATIEELLNGARKYATYCQENKTEQNYIKHPTTWLNQGCWCDEYNSVYEDKYKLF